MRGAHRRQERVVEPQLELQKGLCAAVWVLGIEVWQSSQYSLTAEPSSPALGPLLKSFYTLSPKGHS